MNILEITRVNKSVCHNQHKSLLYTSNLSQSSVTPCPKRSRFIMNELYR